MGREVMADSQPAPNALDQALALAAQGFRVFPIIKDGKLPAVFAWPARASYDPEKIRVMFSSFDPVNEITYIREYNVGIATGRMREGYCCIADVDVKTNRHGVKAQGRESLADLDMLAPEPWLDTKRVETVSGGEHLYFRTDKPLRSTAGTIAPGIDTRGEGGYVVAEGSIVGDGSYAARGGVMREMPEWLVDMIGEHSPSHKDSNVTTWLDTEPAMNHARDYLLAEAPLAVEGSGGDAMTLQVAMQVRDRGVSEQGCVELMFAHWNDRCAPPWEYETLACKVSNAYQYATKEIGNRDASVAFDEWDGEIDAATAPKAAKEKRPQLFFEMAKDVEPDLATISLIDNWLEQGATSVVYGGSNIGKTFVVMSGFAYSIATGTDWHGNKVIQGAVLYIAAEAGVSARKRIKALKLHYGREDFPMALVPCPVDLLRPAGDCKAIIDMVAEVERLTGQKVVLIVIDTLSRALAGGDENGPVDMGSFIMNVDRIRAQTKAHLMLVHHSGKNEALGARGWSGLRAATDTEIEVTEGKILGTKQRDIEAQAPIGFTLKSIPIGARPDGKVVTSAVALFGEVEDKIFDEPEKGKKGAKVKGEASGMMAFAVASLAAAIDEHGVLVDGIRVVDPRKWRESFVARYKLEKMDAEDCEIPKISQNFTNALEERISDLFRVYKGKCEKAGFTNKNEQHQVFIVNL